MKWEDVDDKTIDIIFGAKSGLVKKLAEEFRAEIIELKPVEIDPKDFIGE